MKTLKIIAAHNALIGSKLTKMDGEGKIKIIKAIKVMKPIATDYDDFRKDAIDRLKPEGFDEMNKKLEQWQREGDKTTLTFTERAEINKFFSDYQMNVDKCLNEETEKEHEVAFQKLTDDEFKQFADSNDFTAGQLIELMDILQ